VTVQIARSAPAQIVHLWRSDRPALAFALLVGLTIAVVVLALW
jgi:hypothetical protein